MRSIWINGLRIRARAGAADGGRNRAAFARRGGAADRRRIGAGLQDADRRQVTGGRKRIGAWPKVLIGGAWKVAYADFVIGDDRRCFHGPVDLRPDERVLLATCTISSLFRSVMSANSGVMPFTKSSESHDSGKDDDQPPRAEANEIRTMTDRKPQLPSIPSPRFLPPAPLSIRILPKKPVDVEVTSDGLRIPAFLTTWPIPFSPGTRPTSRPGAGWSCRTWPGSYDRHHFLRRDRRPHPRPPQPEPQGLHRLGAFLRPGERLAAHPGLLCRGGESDRAGLRATPTPGRWRGVSQDSGIEPARHAQA